MSLHTLAQHLQTAGRGDDKVLVHMTPNEVQGLQSLAMAHGGSLTVNPETGLPEAGFLSNLLPTIIGAGLSIASGGALSPLMAAGITGAGYGIATGSLGKGLMAGLGAYGGAGLASSLASAAPIDPAIAAMQTPALNVATAQMPVAAGSLTPAAGTGVEAMKAGMYGTNAAGVPQGIFSQAPAPIQAGFGPQNLPQAITGGQFPAQTTAPIVRSTEATVADTGMRQAPSVLTNVGAGIKELFNDPEKLKKYVSENKMTLASSLLPALLSREEAKRAEEPVYNLRNYNWNRPFNPSPLPPGSTAERTYFADGGMTVENMSQQNAMMDNQKYPMAYQNTPTYALPSERPISQNVLYPATDAGVTPYSGIASLANGGPAVDKYGVERYKDGKSTSSTTLTPGSSTAQPKQTVATPLGNISAGLARAFGPQLATALKTGAIESKALTPVTKPIGGLPVTTTKPVTTAAPISQASYGPPAPGIATPVAPPSAPIPKVDTLNLQPGSSVVTAPVSQPSSVEMPKGITALINKLTDPKTDISGTDRGAINKNFNAEITKQTNELNTFKNNATVKQALNGKFGADIQAQVKEIITNQQADIDVVTSAKNTALDEFTSSTKRTGEEITARSYTGTKKPVAQTGTTASDFEPKTITVADVDAAFKKQGIQRKPTTDEYNRYTVSDKRPKTIQELNDQIYDFREGNKFGTTKTAPTGQKFAEEEQPESGTYKKIAYGSVDPRTGWDKTVKFLEPDDVKRVYEEVAGRSPTQAEIDKYISGKKMSMQGLADAVNKLPEIVEKRATPFSDDELQEQAKYYWGRELSTGELASFRNKKFTTFAQLRNALGAEKYYIDNLNKLNEAAFTKQQTSLAGPAALLDVSSKFYDIMQRKPSSTELDELLAKNLTEADLEKELKKSNEYVHRFLLYSPDSDKYIGDLNPYGAATKPKEEEVTEEEVTEEVTEDTTGTTGGKKGTVILPFGGGSGLVPGVESTPLSAADLEKFKREYREYKPSDYSGNVSTYLTSILPQNVSTQSIYTPLGATGALPEYKIEGAMPYYRPEETLGLTNLYSQLAAKAPDLATGLSFTPSQGQIATSPFANTTPGLITLKSSALPQKYVPPTPIIPGTTTQIEALTPAEQAILSSYQSLPQNVEPKASGGIAGHSYNLGDYSDGGRLLKGPGDGVSDSIPASIGNRRPARLADGEFVIPARIVSELGNGSTDAGARQLYAMMDRIQKARRRSVGKGRVAVDSNARKLLPV